MRQLSRKEWPYQIQQSMDASRDDRYDPKIKWLWEYFGPGRNNDWNYVSIGPFMTVYCFKKEQDLMMFTLRWAE